MSNSSWLKLEWAKYHLERLKNCIRDYDSCNQNVLRQEYDEKSNTSYFVIRVFDDPKDSLALLIGDIIHNARSSLDHLSCKLLIDEGLTPSRRSTYYPFALKTSELNKKLKDTGLDKVSDERKEYFFSHPPSKEANPLLYALHSLDNIDKHNTITPVASFVQIQHLVFDPRLGMSMFMRNRLPLDHGMRFFGGIPGELSSSDFTCESFPVFTISDDDLGFAWSDNLPDAEDDIVAQLEIILSEVDKILSHFCPR